MRRYVLLLFLVVPLLCLGADTDSLTQLGIKGFNDAKQAHRIESVGFEVFGEIGNLGEDVNDVVVVSVAGYNTIGFRAVAPTGGEVTFEASFDGTTFEAVSMRSITDDVYASRTGNGSNFIGSISGARLFRFRTSSAGSAPGTIIGTILQEVSTLESQEFGFPPHRFGYSPIHVDAQYTAQQTGTVIFQTPEGFTGVVTDIMIIVSGSTDGTIRIYDETDTTGNYIFNAYVEVSTNKNFVVTQSFVTPFVQSGQGNAWKITTTAAMEVSIVGHGYIF